MDKPSVVICTNCQKENPAVDSAVKSNAKNIRFNHGICQRHALETLSKSGIPQDKIQSFINRMGSSGAPDLKEHPELVKSYSKGLFTPQQIQQSNQDQQNKNNKITERFQVLAGIHKFYD